MKYSGCLLLLVLLLTLSCRDRNEFEPYSVQDNFDLLWSILDERYCFFEMKEVDWDEVRVRYQNELRELASRGDAEGGGISRDDFFDLLASMLNELKDGHVNLSSAFDVSRYEAWFDDYPDNFDYDIVRDNYLTKKHRIAAGFRYNILVPRNIGYVYYGNFSSPVGEGNIEEVFYKFKDCDGLIIDVRNNGGGNLSYVEAITSRFAKQRTLVGYTSYKTGKGHNDFSEPRAVYIEPTRYTVYNKPVVVLTNRRCYSATNDFVNRMRYLPQVVVMGDKTGGGGGFPFSSELPIGWGVRFSSAATFDCDMNHIEEGVEPHIYVATQPDDAAQGIDTIIEAAIANIWGRR